MVVGEMAGLYMWMKEDLDIGVDGIEDSALEWKVGLRKGKANNGLGQQESC